MAYLSDNDEDEEIPFTKPVAEVKLLSPQRNARGSPAVIVKSSTSSKMEFSQVLFFENFNSRNTSIS